MTCKYNFKNIFKYAKLKLDVIEFVDGKHPDHYELLDALQ